MNFPEKCLCGSKRQEFHHGREAPLGAITRKAGSPPKGAAPIGYKHPPRHTQFKKRQSGNPSGKKAKRKPVVEDRLDLSETITVTVQAKRVTMTKRKALYDRLFALGAGGNLKAMELLFRLDALNDNQKGQSNDSGYEVSDSEEALIARFLKRHAGDMDQGGDDE